MEKDSGSMGVVREEILRAEIWLMSQEERVEDKSLELDSWETVGLSDQLWKSEPAELNFFICY